MNKLQGCKQLVVVALFSNTWPSDLGAPIRRAHWYFLSLLQSYSIVAGCVENPNIPTKSNILVHILHLNPETKKWRRARLHSFNLNGQSTIVWIRETLTCYHSNSDLTKAVSAVFSLNFSSAGKGPFMASKVKVCPRGTLSWWREGGSGVRDMAPP